MSGWVAAMEAHTGGAAPLSTLGVAYHHVEVADCAHRCTATSTSSDTIYESLAYLQPTYWFDVLFFIASFL